MVGNEGRLISYGGGGSPSVAVGEFVFRLGKFIDGEYNWRPPML